MRYHDLDLLEAWLRTRLPDLTGEIQFQPIQTGLFNTSYYVHNHNQKWVLRMAPPRESTFLFYERNMMKQEPALHQLILKKTNVPVPEIICFDDSQEILDCDCMLMECLPGKSLTEISGISFEKMLNQIGQYLAEIHKIIDSKYGYLGAHQPMEPQDNWQNAFYIMWNKLIDDIESVGHLDHEEESILRKTLDNHIASFTHSVQSSLLHMDVWQQNILVNEKSVVTGLLDWDRALWGDPEIEFAVLDYCGISEPAFWQGYGKKRDQSQDAQVRGLFYYLYELLKYIVIEAGRKGRNQSAKTYKMRGMQILQQSGLI